MRSKYGNRKTTVCGITFDSGLEANRYLWLRAAQERGDIAELETQPPFELAPSTRSPDGTLHRAVNCHLDFSYRITAADSPLAGVRVIEDTKGVVDEAASVRIRIVAHQHPEAVVRIVRTPTDPLPVPKVRVRNRKPR